MILADFEIEELIRSSQLINPFDESSLSNCRYNLRAGKAFAPNSGDQLIINDITQERRRQFWAIKPTETLVIMTLESVKIPDNLMATYGQLNGLAQQGLLLINASIVEPGYEGPLSCYFVNFSKETIYIRPHEAIAKISFQQLAKPPRSLKSLKLDPEEYKHNLSVSAAHYPTSFMDVSGIEDRVSDRVSKKIDNSIKFGSALIVVALLWSSLEPLTSKYLWEKIGVVSTSQNEEVNKLRTDLEQAKSDLDKAQATLQAQQAQQDMSKKLQTQQNEIDHLRHSIKLPVAPGRPTTVPGSR